MADTYAKRRAAWEAFHAANPEVLHILIDLALEAKRSGARVGIRLCWEQIRWRQALKVKRVDGEEEWRLSDHYPPFYARHIDATIEELRGYFELRDRDVPEPEPLPYVPPEQVVLL